MSLTLEQQQKINRLKTIERRVSIFQPLVNFLPLGVPAGATAFIWYVCVPLYSQDVSHLRGVDFHYDTVPCTYTVGSEEITRWSSKELCPAWMDNLIECLTPTAPKIFPKNFGMLEFLCGQKSEADVTFINGTVVHMPRQSMPFCRSDNPALQIISAVLQQVGSNIKNYELLGCDENKELAVIFGVFFCIALILLYISVCFVIHSNIKSLKDEAALIIGELAGQGVEIPVEKSWCQQAYDNTIGRCVSVLFPVRRSGQQKSNEETHLLENIAVHASP